MALPLSSNGAEIAVGTQNEIFKLKISFTSFELLPQILQSAHRLSISSFFAQETHPKVRPLSICPRKRTLEKSKLRNMFLRFNAILFKSLCRVN